MHSLWRLPGVPRIVLGKLTVGKDVDDVNTYLRAATPWAGIGSTWGLRPNGDYDFSLPPLTAILYLFGDRPDLLYPETPDHLLGVLLNQEGEGFRVTVPGSLHLVQETENHILMTEGSRYLKNQWLREHGSAEPHYDNRLNGLESRLVSSIGELELAGPYEFNSNPYAEYALMDLTNHPHNAMMRVWADLGADRVEIPVENNTHQALYAAFMPYRLTAEHLAVPLPVNRRYYVRIGRGPEASPEIYSAGNGYLHSAGGTGRAGRQAVTEVGAWRVFVGQSSGVTTAVGDTSRAADTDPDETDVPTPTAVLYVLDEGDRRRIGLSARDLAVWLQAHNGSAMLREGRLELPDGREVSFDLGADANTWVIVSVNGRSAATPLEPTGDPGRDLTRWHRLGGWIEDGGRL